MSIFQINNSPVFEIRDLPSSAKTKKYPIFDIVHKWSKEDCELFCYAMNEKPIWLLKSMGIEYTKYIDWYYCIKEDALVIVYE